MSLMLKWIDKITLCLGIAAAAAVILMMVHVTLDVILRGMFDIAIPATMTLVSNYYMPFITFLPLAFVERLDQHIAADVFTQFLPSAGQKHLMAVIFLLCGLVCALLTYATWVEAMEKFRIGAFDIERNMKILTWPARFTAPISYGLLTALFALKLLAYLLRAVVPSAKQSGLGLFLAEEELPK